MSPSAETIEEFYCHYNDLERSKTARKVLDALLEMKNLKRELNQKDVHI